MKSVSSHLNDDFAEKGGVDVAEVTSLFKSITETCSHLRLRGLMTIGQYDYDTSQGINPDFVVCIASRVLYSVSVCIIVAKMFPKRWVSMSTCLY